MYYAPASLQVHHPTGWLRLILSILHIHPSFILAFLLFHVCTGYTGSLRYMAPEVALREPYSEKVDVYSFGIMLWQMARDSVPFSGLGKTAFMQEVVRGNLRPKLDRAWPEGFSRLLTNCWAREPEKRPSFAIILRDLKALMNVSSSGPPTPTARNLLIRGIGMDRERPNSGWF